MPVEFETSQDTSTGSFLKEPGTYHLMIADSQEHATDKGGKPLDAFRLCCQVLAGTTPGQEGKTVDLLIFHPKPTDKKEGEFALKRRTRTLIAISMMKPINRGEKVSVDLTPNGATGRQFICTLAKSDKGYLEMNFADVYHVDDPEAAAFPKATKLLAMLPAEWRLTAKDFGVEQSTSGAAPSAKGNGQHAAHNAAAKTAAASGVDLDNI